MTPKSIQKCGARKIAQIFKDEVLNNSKFTFKNILVNDGLGCTCGGFDGRVEGWENMWGKNLCNCKRGDYDRPGRTIFSKDYYKDYIADGITNYWDGPEPRYDEYIKSEYIKYIKSEGEDENCDYARCSNLSSWNESIFPGNGICADKTNFTKVLGYTEYDILVPKDYEAPGDETATDIMRREQFFFKHTFIWSEGCSIPHKRSLSTSLLIKSIEVLCFLNAIIMVVKVCEYIVRLC